MTIRARFRSICPGCGGRIEVGQTVSWSRGSKARHVNCALGLDSAEEREYQQGLADGRRYSAERRIYGEALAERFAIEDEMAAFNRGEDY